MENRIKSQYGDEEVNKPHSSIKQGVSGVEVPSNEIPIIDFYPSEDEYRFEAEDFQD